MKVVLISSSYPPPRITPGQVGEGARSKGPTFLQGGIAVHVGRLAHALAMSDHQVTVFSWSPRFDSVILESGVTVCRISPSQRTSDSAYPDSVDLKALEQTFAKRAQELCFGHNIPDVIHCHHSAAFAAARGLGRMTGAQVVSTAHMLMGSPFFPGANPYQESARKTESEMFQHSAHIIAVSKWLRGAILEQHRLPSDRVSVIYSGLPRQSSALSARVHGLGELEALRDRHLITFTGRLSEEKGIDAFLSIARLVLNSTNNVVFAVAGGYDAETQQLKNKVSEDRQLNNCVIVLGWLDTAQLEMLRSESTLIVVPSLYESFGYAALEAMSSGVPVVCSDAGGLTEIVEDGVTGVVVPLLREHRGASIDANAFACAILTLLSDVSLRRRMSEAGKAKVSRSFSEDSMVAQILRVYRSHPTVPETTRMPAPGND